MCLNKEHKEKEIYSTKHANHNSKYDNDIPMYVCDFPITAAFICLRNNECAAV